MASYLKRIYVSFLKAEPRRLDRFGGLLAIGQTGHDPPSKCLWEKKQQNITWRGRLVFTIAKTINRWKEFTKQQHQHFYTHASILDSVCHF